MINETDAKNEVFRLRGLRGFPKPPADMELVRVATENARDVRHLHSVITAIVDDESNEDCPRPGRLRSLLKPAFSDDNLPAFKKCPDGLCSGDGWHVGYSLHTKSGAGVKREPLTAEQAELLWRTIDPAKQVIYEGVTRCTCQIPGGSYEA